MELKPLSASLHPLRRGSGSGTGGVGCVGSRWVRVGGRIAAARARATGEQLNPRTNGGDGGGQKGREWRDGMKSAGRVRRPRRSNTMYTRRRINTSSASPSSSHSSMHAESTSIRDFFSRSYCSPTVYYKGILPSDSLHLHVTFDFPSNLDDITERRRIKAVWYSRLPPPPPIWLFYTRGHSR